MKVSVAWNVEIFQKARVKRMLVFFSEERDNFMMIAFLFCDSSKLCLLNYNCY